MKKVLLTLAVMGVAASVLAQGTLNFNNSFSGTKAPVYGPQTADTSASLTGNTTAGTPAGTTVYTGAALAGTRYRAQFFGDLTADNLVAATTINTFRTTSTTVGLFLAGVVATFDTIPSAFAGTAFLQVRVWDNASGQYPTWAEAGPAWQQAKIAAGMSAIFSQTGFGGGATVPTNPSGIRSFNIYMVPEPGTLALAGLGVASLLVFRRRK